MNIKDCIEFNIQVSGENMMQEDIDLMTRRLLSELRELDIESAELGKSGFAPQGAKGDSTTIGSIIISTLPTVLPAVVTLAEAWSARGRGRIVKFKGKGIEFEGSPEEFQKLLAPLEKGKKK